MNKKNTRYLLTITFFLLLSVAFFSRVWLKDLWLNMTKEALPQATGYEEQKSLQPTINQNSQVEPTVQTNTDVSEKPKDEQPVITPIKIAATINLDIPFTSQAPTGNWAEVFNEACEEASIIMVDHYYDKQPFISGTETEKEILAMIAWIDKRFGVKTLDINLNQAEQVFAEYLSGYQTKILVEPTIEQIKKELSSGHPVIIPVAGRMLGNPNFRAPGPVYHMLVIKGYTADKFITNDPGTRRGENYLYDYQTIMEAIHDWNNGADILQGAKRVMVVYPN
ncbi:MAG: C39 family peptidase [Patescibacteria group bacterium]|jgi:hypothetical protein